MDVLAKVRFEYSNLTKADKKIADYLLLNSVQMISQTASEIGHHSNVSSATVIRFVKKMGFSGLEEMKVQLATEFGAKGYERKIDPIVSKNDSLEMLCAKVKSLINETASDLLVELDLIELESAIKTMKTANTIYLLGIGSSVLPAYDLFHKFTRANKRSFFSFDTHITLEALSFASKNDAIVVFSYSGHTKEMLLAMEHATRNSIPLIVITRNTNPKLKGLADSILKVPSNEHLLRVGAFSSLYSSMMVANILYLGIIQHEIEDNIESRMIATKNIINPLKDNNP